MPEKLRIGSLFSGAGWLDLAVEEVFGARTFWVSDIEPGPRKVLAHRFPGVPNLGDITAVDWSQVEPVEIISGGSPCQDISSAGRMAGMREGTRSNLWVEMREAVATLNPHLVIWENVRGALSSRADSAMESDPGLLGDHPAGVPVLRALGRVLGDLADLGYDAIWHGLRAADIGAPHGRFRIFVVAANTRGQAWRRQRVKANNGNGVGMPLGIAVQLLPTPTTRDHKGRNQRNDDTCLAGALLPTPTAADSKASGANSYNGNNNSCTLTDATVRLPERWGKYADAIHRWEILTRPAPPATKPGRTGRPKLNPAFAEWMMGAPAGWTTDTPGVTDTEALRMAGNGVVRQQAVAALRLMLNRMELAA